MVINKIKSLSKFRRRVVLGITGIVIFIVFAFTINTYLFHKQRYYFGTVTSTSTNSITITTKFNNERVIALSSNTKFITSQRTQDTKLNIGQRVMVISFENSNKEREAKLIRLFK